MTVFIPTARPGPKVAGLAGMAWLAIGIFGAAVYFQSGLLTLARAWSTPEYSHGPLIPLLSAILFVRQLRSDEQRSGSAANRVPGASLLIVALALGAVGRLVQIGDIVAYAIILWVAGMVLIVLGWQRGRLFWPSILHLVFMLPLPEVLYYGLSTYLQGISSQLGVFFLRVLSVPVFLDGNVIDLGTYKLQVAEACSGLRYLFPILSFSYIFSLLYRGPVWHKILLLVSAGPLTVVMNSIRIAIAGLVVDRYGTAFVEGLTHFLEGWVIFIACVALLFAIARILVFLRRDRVTLAAALDLDFDGLWKQSMRLSTIRWSAALAGAAALTVVSAFVWQVIPSRELATVPREEFYLFPRELNGWLAGTPQQLPTEVEEVLAADDYYSASLVRPGSPASVDLFMAWYKDQMTGGTHSPTDCLPGAGWEITRLSEVEVGTTTKFLVNRAEIQKGLARALVYFWYEQQGERTPSSYYARFLLMKAKVLTGRSDGALIRLVTPLIAEEPSSVADARLSGALEGVIDQLPRFVPPA